MGTISVSNPNPKIGDTITYTATGLQPSRQYLFGAHISYKGYTWGVPNTSDAAGNASGSYLLGENLRQPANEIDEFVARDPSINAIVAYTAFKIQVAPPPGKYTCTICGVSFATEAELAAHMASAHPTPVEWLPWWWWIAAIGGGTAIILVVGVAAYQEAEERRMMMAMMRR